MPVYSKVTVELAEIRGTNLQEDLFIYIIDLKKYHRARAARHAIAREHAGIYIVYSYV